MSNTPPSGLPDYFAMFQSMFAPAANAQQAAAANPFAMLDPQELERKIGEMETVLAWLKGTTGMIEMSLQTMKYQQSLLATFAEHGKTPEAAPNPDMAQLAQMAGAMNPATWALNMMQATPVPAAPTSAKAGKPPAAAKRKTRKSR